MFNIHKNRIIGLIRWSLLRHKFYIPMFVIVQMILSGALIYGFLFITNSVTYDDKMYLATGAISINIIAVSCVLSPQVVSESKQNGVYSYQKSLPIARILILLSDLLIWWMLCWPGITMSIVIGNISFGLNFTVNLYSLLSMSFVLVSLILVGFSIAYLLPQNLTSMITQVIMMGALLFSPIIYSEERIPTWLMDFQKVLPFVASSNIIRESLIKNYQVNLADYIVVMIWGIIGFCTIFFKLNRRE